MSKNLHIDHLVYATPDLAAAVADIEAGFQSSVRSSNGKGSQLRRKAFRGTYRQLRGSGGATTQRPNTAAGNSNYGRDTSRRVLAPRASPVGAPPAGQVTGVARLAAAPIRP